MIRHAPAGLRGFCLVLLVVISLAYPRHKESDSKPYMTSYVTLQTDVNKILEDDDIHYSHQVLHTDGHRNDDYEESNEEEADDDENDDNDESNITNEDDDIKKSTGREINNEFEAPDSLLVRLIF